MLRNLAEISINPPFFIFMCAVCKIDLTAATLAAKFVLDLEDEATY